MRYLTNLLLVSAGLLLVSGSPAPRGYRAPKGYPGPKGYPAPKGYPVGTKNNKEGYSRRRDDHKGNDYAAQGEDYNIFNNIGSWLTDLARPLIDSAINTAIQKVVDQGIEQVVKDLPNLIEGAVPVLTDKAKKGIQHASEQIKKDHR